MVCIIPMVLLVISMLYFNYVDKREKFINYIIFLSIFIFTTACFYMESQFFYLLLLELTVYPITSLILTFSKDKDKITSILFIFSINIVGSIIFMIYRVKTEILILNFYSINLLRTITIFNFLLYISFIILFSSKLPLIFFHFWLTKAHVSASGTCSMVLASIMLKLGSFGLYKYIITFAFCSILLIHTEISVSVCRCLFFSIIIIRFLDIKYIVACSSILHISLIFCIVGMLESVGIIPSLYIITGHGLVSYILFFIVTIIYEGSLNRTSDFNKSLESLSKNAVIWISFFILLNLGLPPFINFFREILFCVGLKIISVIGLLIFCLRMLASIMFTIYFISNTLFRKKSIYLIRDVNYSINLTSLIYVISLLLLPILIR